VSLVDANFQSPGLRLAFPECGASVDFQSLLNNPEPLKDMTLMSEVPNLTVVPCCEAGDGEMLDPSGLSRFNAEAKACYDGVIYDAGSLAQAGTEVFMQLIGKCLCVVKSRDNKDELQQDVERHSAVRIGYVANDYEAADKSACLNNDA